MATKAFAKLPRMLAAQSKAEAIRELLALARPIKGSATFKVQPPLPAADLLRHFKKAERRIGAEHGGPGLGWFRIVNDAAEARRTVAAGKLAVVLGVEASEPFGCRQTFGIPHCTRAQIDHGLDEPYALGVLGNLLSTGTFWQARTCTGAEHDNRIEPGGVLPPGVSLPGYPPAPHCNTRGLSGLGEHMVQAMMRRGMLVETVLDIAGLAGPDLLVVVPAPMSKRTMLAVSQ